MLNIMRYLLLKRKIFIPFIIDCLFCSHVHLAQGHLDKINVLQKGLTSKQFSMVSARVLNQSKKSEAECAMHQKAYFALNSNGCLLVHIQMTSCHMVAHHLIR